MTKQFCDLCGKESKQAGLLSLVAFGPKTNNQPLKVEEMCECCYLRLRKIIVKETKNITEGVS